MKKVLKISLAVLMVFILVGCGKKTYKKELVYTGKLSDSAYSNDVDLKLYRENDLLTYEYESENIKAIIGLKYNKKELNLVDDKLKCERYIISINMYDYNYTMFDRYKQLPGYEQLKIGEYDAVKTLTDKQVIIIVKLDSYAQLEIIGDTDGYIVVNELDNDKDFNDIINSVTIETTKKY